MTNKFEKFVKKVAVLQTHAERGVEQDSAGLLSPATTNRLMILDNLIVSARELVWSLNEKRKESLCRSRR